MGSLERGALVLDGRLEKRPSDINWWLGGRSPGDNSWRVSEEFRWYCLKNFLSVPMVVVRELWCCCKRILIVLVGGLWWRLKEFSLCWLESCKRVPLVMFGCKSPGGDG